MSNILSQIQTQVKCNKNQYNGFGKYNYRSCEDIMEAVKPYLSQHGATLLVSDSIEEHGGRVYVKATANFTCGDEQHSVTAFAREPENKKGMDESQITGAASSYARKYALAGLFLLDDNKDADATEKHGNDVKQENDDFITVEQIEDFKSLAKEVNADLKGFCNWFKVEDVSDIKQSQYKKAISALEAKRGK